MVGEYLQSLFFSNLISRLVWRNISKNDHPNFIFKAWWNSEISPKIHWFYMVLCQFSVSSPLFPTGLPLRQQGLRHLEVTPTGHVVQGRAAVQVLARSKGWVGTDGVQKQVENDGNCMNIFTKTGEKNTCKYGEIANWCYQISLDWIEADWVDSMLFAGIGT